MELLLIYTALPELQIQFMKYMTWLLQAYMLKFSGFYIQWRNGQVLYKHTIISISIL